ncbi:LamG-like jellyroll fold domain-containing protein [Reichenbachiella sp. MALMAid0571]|uniref:LamG-like jellyroll fold domain-containing protein n=1 Tax=Reichenbachiella sp. MALMAid0571 TaxID=3143939 RepID=UPI0032E049F9
MKNKIFIVGSIIMLLTQISFAQAPIVYLPLDSDLNDESGNDLHATNGGTADAEFVNDGERGSVAFFPKASHAQLPLDPKLDFGTSDFSFAFWVKIDNATLDTESDPAIISNKDWGDGTNTGFVLALDGAGVVGEHQWTVNVADDDALNDRLDWDADDNATPNLVDNTWHFVAVVFDRSGANMMNVYFDGELKQTDAAQDSKDLSLLPGNLSDPTLPFTIMNDGTGNYNQSRDFEASLDDILIYDRVITADEVADLHANGYSIDPALGASVYLPFDSDLNDVSGNDLHATNGGTADAEFVSDAVRGDVAFFPKASHAQLPLDPKLDFGTSDFSFAFWVKIDNATLDTESDPAIISNKDWGSGENTGFVLALDGAGVVGKHQWTVNVADDDALNDRLDWDADDNATPNLVDNTWHFVAVVFDRSGSNTMNVYFDGELKQTDAAQDSKDLSLLPGNLSDPTLPFTIMNDATGAYNQSRDFEAWIDDLRIWSGKALSATEVMDTYNFVADDGGIDMVFGADVYLPLDENLNDESGNDLHAINGGTQDVVFVNDTERGLVADFPLASHAKLPLDDKLDFGVEDFSFAFWVKVDAATLATASDPAIISNKDWGGGENTGFVVALDGAGVVGEHQWTVNVADDDALNDRLDWDADDNDTPNLVDNAWHFIAVVFDRSGANMMNVYFDGKLKQSDPDQDSKDLSLLPGNLSDPTLPFTIMNDATGAYNQSRDFSARLDDVRIWKGKALTATEVLEIYSPYDKSYEASVFLPFNNNLEDFSGNELNATDVGVVSTEFVVDAERGDVAFFPKTAFAQLPLDPKLEFGTDDFSVAFWVKIDDATLDTDSDPAIMGNKNWDGGSNPGFVIALDGATIAGSNRWTVNAADDHANNARNDWESKDNGDTELVDNTWHFVAVSFDRDATLNVYFDGELKQIDQTDRSKNLTILPGNIHDPNLHFNIMQDGSGIYNDPREFAAWLDNVRIWNRVITPTEVMTIFTQDTGNGATVNEGSEVIVLNIEELEKQPFSVYPNPIRNGWSRFNFSLDQPSQVNLVIYNQSGMVVENRVNENLPSGNHTIEWNASGNQSGMYYYRLQGANIQQSGKIILVR